MPTQLIKGNLFHLELSDYGLQSHLQNTVAATLRLVFE